MLFSFFSFPVTVMKTNPSSVLKKLLLLVQLCHSACGNTVCATTGSLVWIPPPQIFLNESPVKREALGRWRQRRKRGEESDSGCSHVLGAQSWDKVLYHWVCWLATTSIMYYAPSWFILSHDWKLLFFCPPPTLVEMLFFIFSVLIVRNLLITNLSYL